MKGSPDQLSLPLFESHAEQQRSPTPRPRALEPMPQRRVAPSRALSQPVADRAPAARGSSPALLTTSEAAEALHVHPRTVQRLVERGQLDAIHLGAAVRFDPRDVAELTARHKRTSHQSVPAAVDVLRPGRPVRISFADRLRSQHG